MRGRGASDMRYPWSLLQKFMEIHSKTSLRQNSMVINCVGDCNRDFYVIVKMHISGRTASRQLQKRGTYIKDENFNESGN